MANPPTKLTRELALERLSYDPETGIFRSNKTNRIMGNKRSDGYMRVGIANGNYKAHRLAWLIVYGELPKEIDHINRVKSDNRIANLRACSSLENVWNRPLSVKNTNGMKGVSRTASKTSPWAARISIKGKSTHIGAFLTAEEASLAYEEVAKEIHGDFYWKNIQDTSNVSG